MAYGIKYRLEYRDFETGSIHKIDFLFKDYVGSILTVTGASSPFVIDRNKEVNDQNLGGILLTKYKISVIGSTFFTASQFISENYGDILIAKYKQNSLGTDVLEGYGVVIPFECRDMYEYDGSYEVSIGAECGLSFLKTLEYKADTSFYTGRQRLIDIIYNCLSKIPFPDSFPLISINNTKIFQNGEEIETLVDSDYYKRYTDNEGFKISTYSYKNCFEVLTEVVGPLSEFFFEEGYWHIRCIPELLVSIQTNTPTYQTIYTNEGEISERLSYTPVKKIVGQNILAYKNGIIGNYLSQKTLTINQKSGFLVNNLAGGTFKHTGFDLLGWNRETSFSSTALGGNGTLTDPWYFRFDGSVYRQKMSGTDTQYIESDVSYFQPYGVEIPDVNGNNVLYLAENLKLTGKVEFGRDIISEDIQIIIGDPAQGIVYYYTSNNEWVNYPAFYTLTISKKPLGTFDIDLSGFPNDLNLYITPGVLFTPVPIKIRLFRGNRGSSENIPTAYYYVKYYELSLSRIGRGAEQESYKEENRNFWTDKTADKAKTMSVEVGIGNSNYPYAYGAIYPSESSTLGVSQFQLFGTEDLLPYNYYVAHSYLKILTNRLKFFEGEIQGNVRYGDFIVADSVVYRCINLTSNPVLNQVKIKAQEVKIDLSSVIYNNLNQAKSEGNLAPSTDLPSRGSAPEYLPSGDNYDFNIDEFGRKFFKLSETLRLKSILPRDGVKLTLGNAGSTVDVTGRLGLTNADNFTGEIASNLLTANRVASLPDQNIIINDWNYLISKPQSKFEQAAPTNSWTINHGYGKLVICQVFDTSDKQIMASVTHLNENQVQIDFNQPKSGYVLVLGI